MKTRIFAVCVALALLFTGALPALAEESGFAVADLKTQGRVAPFGIDVERPTFSWRMASDKAGAAQAGYRIVVRDADDGVVWDSGTVESARSVGIPYEGEALAPSTTYTWTVTVTD